MNFALQNKGKTMTIAKKLRRVCRDLDHETVSNLAGLPDSTLDAIIEGHHVPSAQELFKISRVIDVSTDWLFNEARTFGPRWRDATQSAALHVAAFAHLTNIIRRPITAEQKATCQRLQLSEHAMLDALRALSWVDRAVLHAFVGDEQFDAVELLLNLPDIERAIRELAIEATTHEAA